MLQSTLALLAENSFDWSRGSMFLMCAIVGGSVITLQTLLLLFGFGGMDDFDGLADGDMELDGTESAFGFLSVRAVSAFLCFFGLAGWGATSAGWELGPTLGVAIISGFGIMLVVVFILGLQKKLYSDGNLHPEKIVGNTAKVYLVIPANGKGKGKITVSIQERSEEYDASTASDCHQAIPTGAEVRISRMITPGSFEVEAL
jgi:hypothetical protein